MVTIATFNVFFGLLMFTTHGVSIYLLPDWWIHRIVLFGFQQANGTWAELTLPVLIMAACVLATWILTRYTTTGRQLYAFGDNPEGARRLGINIAAMHFIPFCWLGMMAGIGGLVQVHYTQEVVPNALIGRELDVLAAVVLGGARLGGGRGTVLGCVLGVLPDLGDPERSQPARHLALRVQDGHRRDHPRRHLAVERPAVAHARGSAADGRPWLRPCPRQRSEPRATGWQAVVARIGPETIGLGAALIAVMADLQHRQPRGF